MSLHIGSALKRGGSQLLSRSGAVILAAYALTMLVYQLSFNTLLEPAFAGLPSPADGGGTAPGLVSLPVPAAVAGVLFVATLFLLVVVSIVAVRTFVAGERDRIPRRFLTDHMGFAIVNTLVGGIAFSIVVGVGTLLLVVPGVVAYVGLLFMVQFVAVENENFVTAMRRSWRLTKGNRLRVFALIVVLLAAVFAVTMAVSFGLGVVLRSSGIASPVVGMVNVLTTLYLLAVVSDAFVQLRAGETPEQRGRQTTDALGA